ncbi:MAG: hypothetical protein ACXWDE_11130, partial [Aeromicrobium sp.]
MLVPILALLGLVLTASQAEAAPPQSCYAGNIYHVLGGDHGGEGNHTGVKANLHFGLFGNDCIRVTSVAVNNGGGSVEIGWFMGWDTSSFNQFTGSGACRDGDYYDTPEVFAVWQPIGGGYHCRNLTFEAEDSWHLVNIANPDANTSWEFTEAGHTYDTRSVNFSRGNVRTNGERHSLTYDIAKAHFKSLQKSVAGNGGTWFSFSNSYAVLPDSDPGYKWKFDSQTETEVVAG